MMFDTHISGIPCMCSVVEYVPYIPATWDEPPEPTIFDFELLDQRGNKANWLEKKLAPNDFDRLQEEFLLSVRAEDFGFY